MVFKLSVKPERTSTLLMVVIQVLFIPNPFREWHHMKIRKIVNIVFQGADNDTTQHQANVIKSVMPAALSIVNKYNVPETTTVSSDSTTRFIC